MFQNWTTGSGSADPQHLKRKTPNGRFDCTSVHLTGRTNEITHFIPRSPPTFPPTGTNFSRQYRLAVTIPIAAGVRPQPTDPNCVNNISLTAVPSALVVHGAVFFS
jgi:hypothetical protein